MAAKQLIYGIDARKKVLDGVALLSRAVKATLGPRGKNAVIDRKWGSPLITKDGVTVAKEIELDDPFEDIGAVLGSRGHHIGHHPQDIQARVHVLLGAGDRFQQIFGGSHGKVVGDGDDHVSGEGEAVDREDR